MPDDPIFHVVSHADPAPEAVDGDTFTALAKTPHNRILRIRKAPREGVDQPYGLVGGFLRPEDGNDPEQALRRVLGSIGIFPALSHVRLLAWSPFNLDHDAQGNSKAPTPRHNFIFTVLLGDVVPTAGGDIEEAELVTADEARKTVSAYAHSQILKTFILE